MSPLAPPANAFPGGLLVPAWSLQATIAARLQSYDASEHNGVQLVVPAAKPHPHRRCEGSAGCFPLPSVNRMVSEVRATRASSRGLALHKLDASELKVSARKYANDMVLTASSKGCAFELREAFKSVKRMLETSGMRLNKAKCVVVANTDSSRKKCRKAWKGTGVEMQLTTRDLGVDVQWRPWRSSRTRSNRQG
eukprot:2329801-Amphidinium_carterae.2